MLTAHAETYAGDRGKAITTIIHEFKTSDDRVNAVETLVNVLSRILKIDQYKALSYKEQRVIDQVVFDTLVRATAKFANMPLKITQKETRRWSAADDERAGYAYTTMDFAVTCSAGVPKNADTINALTNLIYPILYSNFPNLCYKLSSAPLTLMCINNLHRDSLFGKLPKDVAIITAKKVKANNEAIFKRG